MTEWHARGRRVRASIGLRAGPPFEKVVAMRWIVVVVTAAVTASAFAEPAKRASGEETGKRETVPGEDAAMYSCRKSPAAVTVTFKKETDVSELVTWVMGFTCKKF